MSFQGDETITRVARELSDEAKDRGYWIQPWQISSMICESDVISTKEWDCWMEFTDHVPGSIEDYPCLVYCTQETKPGSAVNRVYKPVVCPNFMYFGSGGGQE